MTRSNFRETGTLFEVIYRRASRNCTPNSSSENEHARCVTLCEVLCLIALVSSFSLLLYPFFLPLFSSHFLSVSFPFVFFITFLFFPSNSLRVTGVQLRAYVCQVNGTVNKWQFMKTDRPF